MREWRAGRHRHLFAASQGRFKENELEKYNINPFAKASLSIRCIASSRPRRFAYWSSLIYCRADTIHRQSRFQFAVRCCRLGRRVARGHRFGRPARAVEIQQFPVRAPFDFAGHGTRIALARRRHGPVRDRRDQAGAKQSQAIQRDQTNPSEVAAVHDTMIARQLASGQLRSQDRPTGRRGRPNPRVSGGVEWFVGSRSSCCGWRRCC